jgi:glutathionylspermidine synthase
MMRREAEIVGKRFSGKFERVKILEKRLSVVVKSQSKEFLEEETEQKVDFLSDVKTKAGTESTLTLLKRNSAVKEETA